MRLSEMIYTEEEYKKLEERVKFLEEENNNLKNELMEDMKTETELNKEIRKLKNSIEYWKKKADKNQEKANQIDKIMNLPWVMRDWKIDWSKVAFYYCI